MSCDFSGFWTRIIDNGSNIISLGFLLLLLRLLISVRTLDTAMYKYIVCTSYILFRK